MNVDEIRTAIQRALSPGCFFIAPGGELRVEHRPNECCPWEVFRGHLLDHPQTRLRKTFESWDVFAGPLDSPTGGLVLSVKLDSAERQIHVTRNILAHAWEPYELEGGAIATREIRRRVRELVGTIHLAEMECPAALTRELAQCVFLGVVGTSRLPITSLESPLPGFSLGQLAYLPGLRATNPAQPVSDLHQWIERGLSSGLSEIQQARLLETVLRSAMPEQLSELTDQFVARWQAVGLVAAQLSGLVKTLFHHVALSPYTGFVDNLVVMLLRLAKPEMLGLACVVDTIGYLLRHLCRHLTAFDLVTFHNLGANYPDALFLDALLKAYLDLIEHHLAEFEDRPADSESGRKANRMRRRALRQAWLIRQQYDGHAVPDLPTSPGEERRVLPEGFSPVPREQILHPSTRRKRLFAGQPNSRLLTATARPLLEQSIADLDWPLELRELGMALYLDRPLGIFKEPGAVDRTPLLSYEAFSRKIAEGRLRALRRWGLISEESQLERLRQQLCERTPIRGFPVSRLAGADQRGAVALEDARRAAADFVFLRTTRQSLRHFLSHYEFESLAACAPGPTHWLLSAQRVLLIRTGRVPVSDSVGSFLAAFDDRMQPRIEFGLGQPDAAPACYVEAQGVEYLQRGFRIVRVWEPGRAANAWRKRDLCAHEVRVPPQLPR